MAQCSAEHDEGERIEYCLRERGHAGPHKDTLDHFWGADAEGLMSAAMSLLSRLEWAGVDLSVNVGSPLCLICSNWPESGHYKCALGDTLAAYRAIAEEVCEPAN